ncbi:MAG: hypothetical protein M5R40_29460 [Anaerolineae bacterium]|nr:hypothetical protein [Anaerolineae bacterium]
MGTTDFFDAIAKALGPTCVRALEQSTPQPYVDHGVRAIAEDGARVEPLETGPGMTEEEHIGLHAPVQMARPGF